MSSHQLFFFHLTVWHNIFAVLTYHIMNSKHAHVVYCISVCSHCQTSTAMQFSHKLCRGITKPTVAAEVGFKLMPGKVMRNMDESLHTAAHCNKTK